MLTRKDLSTKLYFPIYDGERQVTKPSFPLQSCRSVAGTRAIEIQYVNDSSGAGTTALSPGVHRHILQMPDFGILGMISLVSKTVLIKYFSRHDYPITVSF